MLTKSFDQQLAAMLKREGDAREEGIKLLARYNSTRDALVDQVFGNIKAVEPNMTDHGYDHVRQVQANALRLMSDDGVVKQTRDGIKPIELYCLGMMILFHDAGMIHGRRDHHQRVDKLFNTYVPSGLSLRQERSLIVTAARAHTGTAPDGSMDTLKSIQPDEHLDGQRIRLRELAAILRLADELAEGPKRTSSYLQESEFYRTSSRVYHEYSAAVSVFIDRTNRRISLQYNVEVRGSNNGESDTSKLQALLHFIYHRILKTDQERRYTRQYSDFLQPFEFTDAVFNFHCRGELLDSTGLLPVRLPELVVPNDGESTERPESFWQGREAYEPQRLVAQLLSKCKEDLAP